MKPPRGFTLVEVMIAMMVFTVMILGILGAFFAATSLTEQSRNLTQAVEDARTVVERIRNDVQTSTDIATFSTSFPESTYEDWVADQQAAETEFVNLPDEAIDVTYDNPGEDPLDVTVQVTWEERGGRQRTTSLQTQMTRR